MRHTERLARARTACEEDRHAGERKLERVLLLLVEAAAARAGLGLLAAAARLVEGRRCVGALLAIGEQAHCARNVCRQRVARRSAALKLLRTQISGQNGFEQKNATESSLVSLAIAVNLRRRQRGARKFFLATS